MSCDSGLRSVSREVEVRHLHAVIVLAEDLSFTRACQRLHTANLRYANRSLTWKSSSDSSYSPAKNIGC